MSTMSDDISWKFSIEMIFSIKNGMGKHLHSSFSDTRAPKVYLFLSVCFKNKIFNFFQT